MAGFTTRGARGRRWIASGLVAGVLAGGGVLVGVSPVQAHSAVAVAVAPVPADPSALMVAAAANAARDRVTRLAKSGLPAEIRTSAWNALRSTRGDAAIAEWLAPGGGYDGAKQRLRDTRTRNRAFCERVVSTHPAAFSPEVRSAAQKALKGTDADRAAFVRTGYAEAQQRDRLKREADAAQRLEIAERDRAFVRALADGDPGEQVRVAAQWALRAGATDADIAEFFGYGWATGAALDVEAYRLRVADAEVRRHHQLSLLVARAVAAEAALTSAADTAKARAEAELAWRTVADHADEAHRAWLAEQEATRVQAENWQNIARLSQESADGVWKQITLPAEARQHDWAGEQAEAGAAAAFWQDMADRARDSESRVRG
ncbi:ALF repeat-containing protein [Streptomyces yaizuensis]|uniref:ALF repeat-containing protein n=1 Tax=Streptomyces yaizuensis TaxID=2989713 RepID=A0ABQ5NYF3_9ACTN|nr:ALF repeat-containing protein [Streptomyces sp. YSPA8]GLF94986.1 ALF repeat-containing protein [Streptomyces sp. YSPA8]